MHLNCCLKGLNKIIVIMALFTCVQAYTLDLTLYDYNTVQPIESANVTLYNNSIIVDSKITNINGTITFSESAYNYTVIVLHDDYETYNTQIELDENTTQSLFITPLSTEGLIRLKYSDLTLGGLSLSGMENHEICFYYYANHRLHGCYHTNDTIQLTQNTAYYVYVVPNRADLVTGNNLKTTITRYIPALIGIVVIFILGGVLYYGIKN